MKVIAKQDEPSCKFEDIAVGQTFRIEPQKTSTVFLKIWAHATANAVSLNGNSLASFNNDAPVYPCDCIVQEQ